jgi:hypothetical protein
MKINWGFGIAVVYTLFAAGMILFVIKASQQHYDLVSNNYYDEAVAFQKKIDVRKNGERYESNLKFQFIEEYKEIILSSAGNSINGNLSFYKPDNASEDFIMGFSTGETGKQQIILDKLSHGNWKVDIIWKSNGMDCRQETKIFIR